MTHRSLTTVRSTRPTAAVTFTDVMSTLAAGVAVVTCRVEGRPWGMTVTAFTSVSADPPTVLVSLDTTGEAALAIDARGRFGVSILGADQWAVARYCSMPGQPKFLGSLTDASDLASDSPIIAGALAHVGCEVTDRLAVADHTIFVGRVVGVHASRRGEPLVYFRRAYGALAPATHAASTRRSPRCHSN